MPDGRPRLRIFGTTDVRGSGTRTWRWVGNAYPRSVCTQTAGREQAAKGAASRRISRRLKGKRPDFRPPMHQAIMSSLKFRHLVPITRGYAANGTGMVNTKRRSSYGRRVRLHNTGRTRTLHGLKNACERKELGNMICHGVRKKFNGIRKCRDALV